MPLFIPIIPVMGICGALLLCSGPAVAAWWWPIGGKDGLAYDVRLDGLDKSTTRWVSSLGLDKKNETTPPKNLEELKQESVALAGNLRKAVEARGFYDARISQKILKDKSGIYHLSYHIAPGTRYRISAVKFDWQDKKLRDIPLTDLRIHANSAIDVAAIQQDTADILDKIGKDSCLLSLTVNPLLQLHGHTHRAVLVYRITHGPKANFGPTKIEGTQQINQIVILRAVDWKQGTCFRQQPIEKTRLALIQSQLFAAVRITPDPAPNRFGEVPITVSVKERVPRTVTAGASYTTDQGFGVNGGWEHRNFLGAGEKFNTDTGIAQKEQFITNALRLPGFGRKDQTLVLGFGAKNEDRDAYQSTSLDPSVTMERKLSPTLNAGLGVAYGLAHTKDELNGNSRYGLISFPGFLTYDTRSDPIDPRAGWLGNVSVTPYTETFGDGGRFLKSQTALQTYLSSDALTWKPSLALKGAIGGITGGNGQDVPSDIRFYAGGGGSVRGYGYQSLGPRLNGKPIGGSGMMAGSAELRLRFNQDFGGVAFMDAGSAYNSTLPGPGEKIYVGAGIGIRYYTTIGPLRADIALPMNGGDINQNGYALYVSVGQAF